MVGNNHILGLGQVPSPMSSVAGGGRGASCEEDFGAQEQNSQWAAPRVCCPLTGAPVLKPTVQPGALEEAHIASIQQAALFARCQKPCPDACLAQLSKLAAHLETKGGCLENKSKRISGNLGEHSNREKNNEYFMEAAGVIKQHYTWSVLAGI
uniref:Bm12705 n=1 Tax=Brugia malayi TaxID=6279 RepID=A0A1I9GBB5_BRUMA|nr:Bm12705 [Brugia malayi]